MILPIVSIACAVILATLFIVISTRTKKYNILLKTLASFGFVTAGMLASINLIDNFTGFTLILIGLLCGMAGDILLSLKDESENKNLYLSSGIGAFGIGHILYIAGITVVATSYVNVKIPLAIALGCTPLVVVLSLILLCKTLKLKFGKFQLPVIFYIFILSFATLFAIALGFVMPEIFLFAGGLLLILVSDLLLSMLLFKDKNTKSDKEPTKDTEKCDKTKEIILHSLYYVGQILIVSFIFFFFYF